MVTQAQINQALNVTIQLAETLEQLRQVEIFARDATVAGVPLDSTTITNLLNQYSTLKAQLVTLFGQLP